MERSASAWEHLSVRQLSPQPVDRLLSGIRVHVKNRELPVTSLFERELTSAVDAVLLLAVSRTSPNSSRKGGAKVSVSDLLVPARAVALRMHPAVNASWVVDEILRHRILV